MCVCLSSSQNRLEIKYIRVLAMWKATKICVGIGLYCLLLSGVVLAGTDIRVSQNANPAQVENEPSITINKHFTGPDLLNVVACYNDIGNALGSSWSADSGKTWTDTQLPLVWSTTGDPCVGSDNTGRVHAIFLSYQGAPFFGNSGIYYSQSLDGGRNWSTTVAIDNLIYSGGAPVAFADKCMMAIDTFTTSTHVNNIYVGWQREPPGSTNSDIFFSRSTNTGTSFSTPVQVNDNPMGTAFCEGAFPFVGANGDIYMAWYDSYFQGHTPGSLYVDKSTDGGVTWGVDVKVANFLAPPKYTSGNTSFKAKVFPSAAADPNDPNLLYMTYIGDPDGYSDRRLDVGNVPGTSASDRPDIIRGGTWVFSTWQDGRNGSNDIYFNRSADYGQTWELAAIGPLDNTVAAGSSTSSRPKLAYSVPNVYAVWEDTRSGFSEIYFNYSTNDGQTWMSEVNLSNAPPLNSSSWPTIAAINNFVYVAWHDNRNGAADIYFVASTDYGVTWSTPFRVDLGDAPGATNSFYPKLACSGNWVYFLWRDDRMGTTQPFFFKSHNNGVSWAGAATTLGSGGGFSDFSIHGGLECTGNYVYATWTNNQSGNYDTYFNVSTNKGVNWMGEVLINSHPASVSPTQPHLAFAGNDVYVGWHYGASVYFDRSPDNGVTWQMTDIGPLNPGTGGTGGQWLSLAADASSVYALWYDGRVGGGFGDYWFNYSSNNGANWSGETMLNLGTGPTRIPSVPVAIPVMTAGSGWVNTAWPDSRSMPNGGMMAPGLPNIYTNYSSNNGASWLSGMDEADVYCVNSVDGGATWSSPVTVNDDGTTLAQVIPWVVVKSNGLVDISYYDYVPYQWHEGGQVRLAVSMDGGNTFQPTISIEDMINPAGTHWVGEYNGMATLDDMVYTIFTDLSQTGSSDIYLDRTMNPVVADTDGDGIPDGSDNCPTIFNPGQGDLDGDLIGDLCDPDADGDGINGPFVGGPDCDDMDGTVYPGATEIVADGVDQDCDGCDDCWQDMDSDTWGTTTAVTDNDLDCSNGSLPQMAAVTGDCNDGVASIHPGAVEAVADGVDQDCDGCDVCWQDMDSDTWGTAIVVTDNDLDCSNGSLPQMAGTTGDCHDGVASIHPGATEICNGQDDNCDGTSDAEFGDSDADGWGQDCDNCWAMANPGQADTDGDCPAMPYSSDPVCGDVCTSTTCCVLRVGDANGLGGDEPTIGDISVMIDALFISGDPSVIACLAEADINQSGGVSPIPADITIGDISTLIDYLFITGPSLGLPNCI